MTDMGGPSRRRNLRRFATPAGIALAGVAVAAAITWPLSATGEDPAQGAGAEPAAGAHQHPGREAPGRYVAPAAPGATGTGRDPLTADEEQAAVTAALSGDRPLRTQSKDVAGRTGDPQLISAELAEDVGATEDRIAEVMFYDYGDNSLAVKTVNLTSGKVTDSETARGAQPPPSPPEAAEAAKLLIADPLGDGLRQDYRTATGKALTEAGQLKVQGLVYRPRPGAPAALKQCGEHRCVTLFTRVADGPWIDTRPYVIDLSDRTVHHD
ncbi:hypothetical protein [Streptomyces boninensis]|uniref:hypothetical protein n=1 Tax=Streptomyces boninensis TaxID=2039455 RepID=UPI003B218768